MQAVSQMIILSVMIALLATTIEQTIVANTEQQAAGISVAVANKIFG